MAGLTKHKILLLLLLLLLSVIYSKINNISLRTLESKPRHTVQKPVIEIIHKKPFLCSVKVRAISRSIFRGDCRRDRGIEQDSQCSLITKV
jgi:hypothetical protein